jgi:tripartite-type tricarboxylate transporter receptor subunit TctC
MIATLIAQSKAKPGSINFGTPGNGSTPHLAIELFGVPRASGHVPYRAARRPSTHAGRAHQTVAVALEVLPHVKAGSCVCWRC